jgi:HIV Tat-specific factor 1
MFEPSDFSDASFSDELEGDIATECGKCGRIEKITVSSKNPLGVVIVKFSTSYASQACVKLMDGRFFGGKKLRCYFWDGATDYTGTSSLLCCAHCHFMLS